MVVSHPVDAGNRTLVLLEEQSVCVLNHRAISLVLTFTSKHHSFAEGNESGTESLALSLSCHHEDPTNLFVFSLLWILCLDAWSCSS